MAWGPNTRPIRIDHLCATLSYKGAQNVVSNYRHMKTVINHLQTQWLLYALPGFFSVRLQPSLIEASKLHSDRPQLLWLLWRSDQPDAETSTWQYTPFTRDIHPCRQRDSKPQSQQASGRRTTPQTARPPGSAITSLTFNNSTFCPHSCIYVFCVWIWEQTAIISLYNINWLVFITETECVFCAVRTEFKYNSG